ncbi:DUF4129 domain-containing protein [Actinotalea sp. Marseille-Q4924]|uniref:DUF4129 domain-containing protein n=1 Tax=Actinotalea sp. Marseille-Q4924 TaxID=2866571 RepID=UPI001CE4887D|nr:DUF4129 domain-containing protein [Actinotalea sp. Marseille-Q4924]
MQGTPGAWTGGGPAVSTSPRLERSGAPPWRALAVVVLLGVAVLASALAGPWSPQLADGGQVTVDRQAPPPVIPTTEPPAEVVQEPAAEPAEPPDVPWLRPLLVTATLLGIALLLLHLVRRFLRAAEDPGTEEAPERPGAGAPGRDVRPPDVAALREGVAAAAAHLRSTARPVDAVVAAWVRLEEAAAASGLPRDPASTPTEFTLAVLDRTRADRDATRTLLDLYLRARFGEEHLTADDVAAARRAVDLLAAAFTPDAEPPG